MGEIREEGVSDSLKKNKHKKRKHDEVRVLEGEDGAVAQLDEGGGKKKARTDDLGSDGVPEVHGGDLKEAKEKRSKKEKKKERSEVRGEDEKKRDKKERKAEKSGSGDKKERKGKKKGNGDEGASLKDVESSGGMGDKGYVGRKVSDLNPQEQENGCLDDVEKSDAKGVNEGGSSAARNSEVGVVSEEVKAKKGKKEKKKKRKAETERVGADDTGPDDIVGHTDSGGVTEKEDPAKDKKQKKKKDTHNVTGEVEDAKGKKKMKEKEKDGREDTVENADAGVSVDSEVSESTASKLRKKSKKVKFAQNVEVFPLENDEKTSEDGLLQGKRFSKEEDEQVKAAVFQYIEDHNLGEEGLEMVLKCRKHKDKVKDCWTEIAQALPWRHKNSIYSRAHILFERSESRTWSKEELEEVRQYYEKHGPKWRVLADDLGRNRIHVKDAFRQVRLANKKKGEWSQEEYQSLFNLVNKDLRIRAFMDKKTKYGMLRDNIGWEAISEQLSTRTDPICCQKWYNQLTSSLVVSGQWADTDDYRLLMALTELDATSEEEVEWDYILEHRPGDVCRKRWNEMVRHIGEHGIKSFSEQVEILSQRYCPDVLEAREVYDNKTPVD